MSQHGDMQCAPPDINAQTVGGLFISGARHILIGRELHARRRH